MKTGSDRECVTGSDQTGSDNQDDVVDLSSKTEAYIDINRLSTYENREGNVSFR